MPPWYAASRHSSAAPVSSWAPNDTHDPNERTLTWRPDRPNLRYCMSAMPPTLRSPIRGPRSDRRRALAGGRVPRLAARAPAVGVRPRPSTALRRPRRGGRVRTRVAGGGRRGAGGRGGGGRGGGVAGPEE